MVATSCFVHGHLCRCASDVSTHDALFEHRAAHELRVLVNHLRRPKIFRRRDGDRRRRPVGRRHLNAALALSQRAKVFGQERLERLGIWRLHQVPDVAVALLHHPSHVIHRRELAKVRLRLHEPWVVALMVLVLAPPEH